MKNNFYRLLLLPLLLLAAWGARAQAPAWVGATGITAGTPANSVVQAMTTNAAGDVFVAGTYNSSATFGSTTLSSNGSTDDMFVAKWSTTSNSWVWAVSGGGSDVDGAYGIAVNGANVYVTGSYTTSATISGSSLTGVAGTGANPDLFVAKYVDGGATVSNGGAITGGSGGSDRGTSIGFNGTTVYVAGYYTGASGATISGSSLPGASNNNVFLAKYTDNGALQAGGAVSSATSATERATSIAVNGTAIYIGGYFNGTSLTFGSTTLTGAGGQDMFIARYNDSGTLTPAGAIANGGTGFERITGLAVNGTSVYATGYFSSSPITIAGTSLSAGTTGTSDVFVAKYTYSGSSFSGAGALSNSTTDADDQSFALAANGSTIYITGYYSAATTLSGTTLPAPAGGADIFVAKYTDASGLQPQGALAAGTASVGATDIGTAIAATSTQAFVGGIKDPAAAATFGSFSVPAGPSAFLARVGVNATTVTSIVPANASPTNASSVQFTVTFAASVTGVTTSNFTTSNGTGVTGSSVTSVSGSGTTYTVTVNTGSGSGTLGLTLANDNNLTPGISNEPFTGTPLYTIDKTAPTVTNISSTAGSNGSTTTTTPIPFSITFSESVTGFIASDVTVTGGTLTSGSFSGSGAGPYAFTVTPSGSSSTVTVSVAANVTQDAAGNGNTASSQFSINYQQTVTASSQAVTVNLNANGSGTLTASGVNNGSTGGGTLTYTIQKIAFGYTPESTTPLTLTTPNGANFTQIRFASYGTPNNNANGNYSLGSCSAANSLAAAQNAYVGRSSGAMYASNTDTRNNPVLGDPCNGTPKALAVQVGYSADAASLAYDCTEAGKTQYVLLTVSNGTTTSTSVAQVTVNPPPTATISNVSPNPAQRGTTVTVTGTNLSGVNSVTVNGATATVSGPTATSFTFVVPTGATFGAGNLTVAVPCSQTLTSPFTVAAPALMATVSTSSTSPTSTSPVPFSVSFSQSVGTSFTASDVTVLGGTLTSGSFGGSGAGPYTFTVTPSGSSTVTVSLAANVAQDANNTGNTASNAVSVQFQAPTIVVAPTNSTLPNGTQGTAYSLAFSASGGTAPYTYAITAGALPAGLTLTNGTIAGTPTVNGTFNFTVTATDNSVAPGPYAGSRSYTLTIAPPATVTVVSVTRLTPSPTATAQVSYRVVFSGTVANLGLSNFNLTTSGLSGTGIASLSGSGSTYTVVVNTGTGDGTLRLDVANSTNVSPTISNVPFTSGEQYTITKSFTATPTLRIQAAGSASGNSDVTAFVESVRVLQNGTSTVVTNGVQNGSFESNNVQASNYLYQSQGVVASPWSFGPQAGVSRNNSAFGSTAADGDAVAFLQSAASNNGSISQNLAVPSGSYQVNFRAMQRNYTSLDQRLNVFINDVFVGNIQPNNIPTYDTFTSASFNVTAPALTATITSGDVSNGGSTTTTPLAFTVTFSQSVTGFDATDVKLSNGTLSGFSGSGSTYTFTVTPAANGTVTVDVPANSAVDASNTSNTAAPQFSFIYNQPTTAAPVVTTPANNSFINTRTVTAAGTAPASSIVSIYIGNNLAGTTQASATGTFSFVIPGNAPDGTFTVSATAQSNGAAVSARSNINTFTVDGTAPTVTSLTSSTVAANGTTSTSPVLFTATFSESVTGFTSAGIAVSGGTVTSGPTAGSGNTYTFQVTPSGAGNVTVQVRANAAQDQAGNLNPASASYAFTFQAPTIAITPTSLPQGTQGTAYSVTFSSTGGSGTYTYAITAGALPAGLTLTSGGTLAGTPTTNGTFNFTVTARDNSAAPGPYSGSQAYSLTIAAPAITATTWTGTISTDWFTAGNWTQGVPSSTIDATIPTAPSGGRFPNISAGTAQARNFTLNGGATLTQSGGTLVVAANLTNNGTFQPTGGTVLLGNTAFSNIFGAGNIRFWNLTAGPSGVQLSTSIGASVQRLLLLNGNFSTNGNSFVLESNANLTAQVTNNNGVVNGNVTVQRYIDPSLNPNLGYRHFSSPISTATVGSLATASFSPVVNPNYNTSAQPGTVKPFPTVYGYDQSRLATTTNNLPTFDKGWFSPSTLSDALTVGQGYTVNLAANQTLSLTGPQNNGNVVLNLARNSDATAPDAGLALVGNPYPSPLDWSQVADTDRPGLDAAIFVFQSNDPTNPYAGSYRFYNNGIGTISPVVSLGQAFFVRVTPGQTAATLTLKNSHRPTTYQATTYRRTAAEARPLVQLTLKGAGGSVSDDAFVYFEQGATEGFDSQYDAVKMPNPNGLNISTSISGNQLSIDGRAEIGSVQRIIPLAVGVPAAGSYSFTAAQLLNLDATPVYLRDLQLGTLTDLRLQPTYQFTVTNASVLITNRFELVFSPQKALATVPAALAQQVALYPNPAKTAAFVELPASLGRQAVTATLVDALGREVRTVSLPAQGAVAHQLDLHELATGVYALRLSTSAGVVVKKLVVE